MTYQADILADSIGPHGIRLTTVAVTFPRFILAEVNTHRTFCRNSASSRAIPVADQIRKVREAPFIPDPFTRNRKGMWADEDLDAAAQAAARDAWLDALDAAVDAVERLHELGVHKQHANRLLEPFQWHTSVITATDWDNFFAQRIAPDAQPEFWRIALMIRKLLETREPKRLSVGQWHLPLVAPEEAAKLTSREAAMVSAARCGRVTYLRHLEVRSFIEDIARAKEFAESGHMSPLEHSARCEASPAHIGPLRGWKQLRKFMPGEAVFVPRQLEMR